MKKRTTALVLCVAMLAMALVGGTLAYFTDEKEVNNTFVMGNVKIKLDEQDILNPENRTEEGNAYTDALIPGREFVKDPTITVTGTEEAYVFLDMTINKYKSLFPVMAQDAVVAVDGYTQEMYDACLEDKDNNPETASVFSSRKFLAQMLQNKGVMQKIVSRWIVGLDNTAWQVCDVFYNHADGDVNAYGNYLTFRFAYIGDTDETKEIVEKDDSFAFMRKFQMPETVTQEMMEENDVANDFTATEEAPFRMDFKAYAIQADEFDGSMPAAYKAMFGIDLDTLGLTVNENK